MTTKMFDNINLDFYTYSIAGYFYKFFREYFFSIP